MRQRLTFGSWALLGALLALPTLAADPDRLEPRDVFELEWASDPQISRDGSRIAYVRNSMDIMTDRRRAEIWIVDFGGGNHRPLVSGPGNHHSPRWSPTGDRLLFVSSAEQSSQIHLLWTDTGQRSRLSHLEGGPSSIAWAPDGRSIAFTKTVPAKTEPMASMPAKPEGAEWAEPAKVIERMIYRVDGAGYVDPGYEHIFLLSADGGTPRQLTDGHFDHQGPLAWTPDGESLIFSANRHEDGDFEPFDSEVHELSVASGELTALTDRRGPDNAPVVSPDGQSIAYLGFDDHYQGYQVTQIHVMQRDGTGTRVLAGDLDRSAGQLEWHDDGSGLFFSYSDEGNTQIAFVDLEGRIEQIAGRAGGLSLGRPYSGSAYDAHGLHVAFTESTPSYPADLATATLRSRRPIRRVTELNADLLGHKQLASVEERWVESSHDGRRVQAWVALPPDFDPSRKYPLILEIHGGPFANYGPRFSTEVQLYAAAGYVVLYGNPRGSTSYGEEFGNLIHHNYPGEDYDDLMSMVDGVIAEGFVDPERLFVTGGSGGGVLTAWIVGKTDRFRAAVSAKPVINWTSFVFTSDFYNFFYKYWFPGLPWEDPEQYWRRSPLSLAGNVTTPTMLLTGEADYRTPISESEQYYQALVLEKVDTALVRIPGASHGIAARPSQLIAKVAHILAWFDRHDEKDDGSSQADGE